MGKLINVRFTDAVKMYYISMRLRKSHLKPSLKHNELVERRNRNTKILASMKREEVDYD